MVDTSDHDQRFSWWQRVKLTTISLTGWFLVWLIGSTVRFNYEDREKLDSIRDRGQPVIFCFWHNQIFCQTYLFRFQQIVVMTSRHFDGEYIGRIINWFGYGTARGSSTRGAARALLELKRHLKEGRDVAFTIDGPRGPVYVVKPGPIFLARKSGAPIITLQSEPDSFWQLGSWDRFRIPKPFTRTLVKFGEPIWVSAEDPEAETLEAFQKEMDRIRTYCEDRRKVSSAGQG
jgi:lysophospholipid acyltransferase (LPLAT)-like uncharacterized protein